MPILCYVDQISLVHASLVSHIIKSNIHKLSRLVCWIGCLLILDFITCLQGTEYYDGKAKRYIDFPITDILQMMGRAGRPQYDQHGKAVILVHEPKKSFYKKVK